MKALLLDADGVILIKGELFSDRFAREHNVPMDTVVDFFKGPFADCQAGTKDLKEELKPYLEKWNWDSDVDSFLDYWFQSDFHPNKEGVSTIQQIRNEGVECYLASNNEKYRADYLIERMNQEVPLDGYYFSSYLKVRKEDINFFKKVTEDLNLDPKDCVFIDNDQKNVDAALEFGLEACLYRDGLLEELSGKI